MGQIEKMNDWTPAEFLDAVDAVVRKHAMLDHPFYQAWNEGRLSKEALREYAKQYYAHVRMFPIYLSATHSRCDDIAVRKLLLENLMEEEHGDENHPELWLRFSDGLGVERDAVRDADLLPKTQASVDAIASLTKSDDYLQGVAALYAYESQIPDVARTKREGLKAYYDLGDPRAVSFFTVHEEADLVHRAQERQILSEKAHDEESRRSVLRAAEASAQALWMFLDGVYEAYCIRG